MTTAAILTIGNELTSGDVADTNGAWLARRLERIGVSVAIHAAVPDEIEPVARFIRREAPEVDFVFVTGGLGGTPDDVTREALGHWLPAEGIDYQWEERLGGCRRLPAESADPWWQVAASAWRVALVVV